MSTLLIGEVVVRSLGERDFYGRFRLGSIDPRPFLIDEDTLAHRIATYLSAGGLTLQNDSLLGWAPVPGSRSETAAFGGDGRRISRNPAEADGPAAEFVIATVGDSYTFGAEVPWAQSWGAQLEKDLRARGVPASVRNYGVGGYGIDQALWCWEYTARHSRPDVVIYGFQAENILRNVSIFRPFYNRQTGIFFTKPRFLLGEDQGLRVINQPTVPLADLPSLAANPSTWPLAKEDFFYRESDFEWNGWRRSRLLSVSARFIEERLPGAGEDEMAGFYDIQSTPARLALAIIDSLATSVTATGARFAIVHLPRIRADLVPVTGGSPLGYQAVLDTLEARYDLIDPTDRLLADLTRLGPDSLQLQAHYSARGNARVAEALAERLSDTGSGS